MASPTLDLYYFFVSQPCRAVKLFLVTNGIKFEEHTIDLMKGEQKQPTYLESNPAGLVPAIKEGNFKLAESAAILVYLAESRKTADHWYPSDLKKRARVNEYLHSHHSNLRAASVGVLIPHIFARLGSPEVPEDQTTIKKAQQKFADVLKSLDSRLAAYTYLGGDEISIADLVAATEIVTHESYKLDLAQFPHIEAWLAKVKQTPGWDQVHEPLVAFFEYVQTILKF